MIEIKDLKKCCGCTACENICPTKSITMIEKEDGFKYPKVDLKTCINCNLCEQVCQFYQKNESILGEGNPKAFVMQNLNSKVRRESTSGGIFTLVAEQFVENNGVVYGAAFDDSFEVKHVIADGKNELKKFRGSKYVQSDLGHIFKDVREKLETGIPVCFSGTPCQVEGLHRFLRKKYENLFTVDLVCRGVPSPKLYKSYLNYQEKKNNSKVTYLHFRDKYLGYNGSTMTINFENGNSYHKGVAVDPYLNAFFSGLSARSSCFNCQQNNLKRSSDITLFDCWSVGQFNKSMDDDKGTTAVLVHTKKGIDMVNRISKFSNIISVDVNELINLDGDMIFNLPIMHKNNIEMLSKTNMENFEEIEKKYINISMFSKLRSVIKPIFYKLGVFNVYMKIKKRIKKEEYQ